AGRSVEAGAACNGVDAAGGGVDAADHAARRSVARIGEDHVGVAEEPALGLIEEDGGRAAEERPDGVDVLGGAAAPAAGDAGDRAARGHAPGPILRAIAVIVADIGRAARVPGHRAGSAEAEVDIARVWPAIDEAGGEVDGADALGRLVADGEVAVGAQGDAI